MDDSGHAQTSSGRRRISGPVAWGSSAALHALLIALALVLVWQTIPQEEPPINPVNISFDAPAPPPAPTSEEPREDPPEQVEPSTLLPEPSLEQLDVGALLDELTSRSLQPNASLESRDPLAALAESASETVMFAGLGASDAQSVVYVVDASGSMVSTLPMIKHELMRSVGRLSQTQRFQVIFVRGAGGAGGFEAAPHPMDRDARVTRLIPAFPEYIASTEEWVRGVHASGRSNPLPALESALALQPDAVFVLSTALTGFGDWEPDRDVILQRLDTMNPRHSRTGQRPVVIKTIRFQSADDENPGILQAIGEAHGGLDGFRVVRREELSDR